MAYSPSWLAHPLCMCSFRPFFLAGTVYAVLLMLWWLYFLHRGAGLPPVPGGPFAWHAHELVFGFGLAAVAGFVLTAVPEFTSSAAFSRPFTAAMAALWLAARLAFWLSGSLGVGGIVLAGALNSGFVLALLACLLPRVWRDVEQRHLSFLWGLLAMWLVTSGYHVAALTGAYPVPWARLGISVMMALIIISMSRISMRIVNDALDAERARRGDEDELEAYRARPPRRNLAIFVILLHAGAEFLLPASPIIGWLAFAAAAALLNLLNDWHVGRALLSRWALLLYLVYWAMALGYLLSGLSAFGLPLASTAGLHLLAIGGMGLSIFGVFCIAGRRHAGFELDPRPWVLFALAALLVAAVLRAAAGVAGWPVGALQTASGLAWVAAYALAVVFLGRIYLGPRPDAGVGCEEVGEAEPQ